jgi:hypothetical protein
MYLLPGVLSRVRGASTGISISKHGRQIIQVSNQYWSRVFIPQNSSMQCILGAIWCTGSAVILYKILVVGPVINDFYSWRISRIQPLLDNLTIPVQFHEDEFLSQNICPITFSPIREPVRDPSGHIYEQAAIRAWLDSGHATSPLTRQRLTSEDLEFMNDLFNQITQRLIDLGYNDIEN